MRVDLSRPMDEIRAELGRYPVKTRLSLSGPMVVARDIAHAKIKDRLDSGGGMPDYLRDHCVYYAGPAKTPEGMASGSFGPTTAGRMDAYVDEFQAAGGSMVMLAKGNRSRRVTEACKAHGGFYLGSIGGPAARLSIFMSPLDVHVNRAPVDGEVVGVHYNPGKYFAAFSDKASLDNEQNAIVMRASDGRCVAFVQIAGFLARRIVCRVREGDRLRRGQRVGMIKLGSRVDIYIPGRVTLRVRPGDRVTAGVSVLGVLS